LQAALGCPWLQAALPMVAGVAGSATHGCRPRFPPATCGCRHHRAKPHHESIVPMRIAELGTLASEGV